MCSATTSTAAQYKQMEIYDEGFLATINYRLCVTGHKLASSWLAKSHELFWNIRLFGPQMFSNSFLPVILVQFKVG